MSSLYEVETIATTTEIVEAESEKEAIDKVEARGLTVTGARKLEPQDPDTL